MCRCRLISASICGKRHLAKEHVTRKQMLRVHAQGLLLASCTRKGSSLVCTAWWPLKRAMWSVHCWVALGQFRYGQNWLTWHTEGLWLMETPKADPGINAQSSTFITLLLPCCWDCTTLCLHLLPAWLCKTCSKNVNTVLCTGFVVLLLWLWELWITPMSEEKGRKTEKVHQVKAAEVFLPLVFCRVKIF